MSDADGPRTVSLVPSITEILRAWDRDPIACTKYCEQPDLMHVGGTKNPDLDAIQALAPDLVLVDKEENRREDADGLSSLGLEVVAVDVHSLGSLDEAMSTIANAIGVEVADGAQDIGPRHDGDRLRVFVPIWRRPWMTIGRRTYGADLLDHIGADVVATEGRGDYPEVTLDEVAALDVDAVLVPSEPYVFTDEHLFELATVAEPVRVDGQDLFWWGTRTPAAVLRLRAQLAALR